MDSDTAVGTSRFAKRRKVFRPRHRGENEEDLTNINTMSGDVESTTRDAPTEHNEAYAPDNQEDGSGDGSRLGADILRRRRKGKLRKAGIEFSSTSANFPPSAPPPMPALVPVDKGQSVLQVATNRFAPQTGQAVDKEDLHMMSYVETQMDKRREGLISQGELDSACFDARKSNPTEVPRTRQAAGMGKLFEIDLGPATTLKNIARTEAAQRRLEAGESEEGPGQLKKPRLGKDGKAWRPRKRRNSNDVKRDQLVEAVMRESRLEVYDEPKTVDTSADNEAADDKIAEQFRQDFFDQIAANHVRRSAPAPPGPGGKAEASKASKGPKLGGSRSARAAMRLQEEKKKKKG